jgi:hypothetical protein
MAIGPAHVRYYREILARPGFLAEPLLIFGVQDTWPSAGVPEPDELLRHPDLGAYLRARGLREVLTLDRFDERADLRYDMNHPVPAREHGRFATVIDIGCLEHVFDTRQCLESCLRMLQVGGHYLLHTPVNGYHRHGLHTFHPEVLPTALELNGFEIVYRKLTTPDGVELARTDGHPDVLLWVVARKTAPLADFVCPQQGLWSTRYVDRLP